MRYLKLEIENNDQKKRTLHRVWAQKIKGCLWVHLNGRTFIYNPVYASHQKGGLEKKENLGNTHLKNEKKDKEKNNNLYFSTSPVHGRVLKIDIKEGESIKKGDRILILESMKMEHNIKSEFNGKILKLYVKENSFIQQGKKLALIHTF